MQNVFNGTCVFCRVQSRLMAIKMVCSSKVDGISVCVCHLLFLNLVFNYSSEGFFFLINVLIAIKPERAVYDCMGGQKHFVVIDI